MTDEELEARHEYILDVNTNDLRDYADEISNPYAKLIRDAAHQLDVARTDRNILDGLVAELTERLKAMTALVEKLESEADLLRTALKVSDERLDAMEDIAKLEKDPSMNDVTRIAMMAMIARLHIHAARKGGGDHA